jgi:phosphopentomutase
MKRVFLIVLDSVGAGYLPDAKNYGDEGAFTLKTLFDSGKLNIPNLINLGIGNIEGLGFFESVNPLHSAVGKLKEKSKGKDTTTGHWEIAGVISEKPMPTYPDGFPDYIIKSFEEKIGRKVLCNKPYSGTEVIKDFGEEHLKTGYPIVYTSADSVFQIATHKSVIPLETLYDYCKIARKILVGKDGVGRVIARPFDGEIGNFYRTAERHDFSLEPPKSTILDILKENNKDVIAVGKINDIFAGRGITEKIITHGNTDGLAKSLEISKRNFDGLCFINLVDFDMLYGHRNDIIGYANALNEFDLWLNDFMKNLKDDDIVMITADHGCDPGYPTTDHTREYIPFICFGKNIKGCNIGVREQFSDIALTIAKYFNLDFNTEGKEFLSDILI